MNAKKHKYLIIFFLLSLSTLLVYDLFYEVETRGVVTSARLFPRILRLSLLGIYFIYYYSLNGCYKSKFNQIFASIYSLIIIYVIFNKNLSIESIISLSKILYILFTYLIFYKLILAHPITSIKYLKKFAFSSILILSSFIILTRLGNAGGVSKVYGDNNSYILLSFLPFTYLLGFRQKNFLLFVLMIAVFLSLKRGAIFALIIAISPIIFYKTQKVKSISKKIKKLLFLTFSSIVIYFLYVRFQELFLKRIEDLSLDNAEDFGSGRGLVYLLVFDDWYNSGNFFTYLFGNGYHSVEDFNEKIYGKPLMAHSDFLNFIYSYGLIGISLLGWFIIYQVKIIYRLFRLKSEYYVPYFMIFTIFFFKAIYSGNFEMQNFTYMLIVYATLNALLITQKFRV